MDNRTYEKDVWEMDEEETRYQNEINDIKSNLESKIFCGTNREGDLIFGSKK